ncbi:HNH endonuclease signature motif containing protein [Patescibacteria group bacterium]
MTDEQHFQLFRKRGALLLKGRKEFIAMIPRIYKNGKYKEKGFGSIYECAAKIGGISHAMVDEVIRVEQKLKDMPRLRNKIAEVGLSKIKTVANIVTKETDKEWSEKVTKMTRVALETHIRDINNPIPGESITATPQNIDFENFQVKLHPGIILKLKIIKQKMGKGTTWNDVFGRLTDLPQPRSQKNPRPSNPKKRHLATKTRHELEGKCSYPGCNKPAAEIHHKKPWAKYRSHDELERLCKPHHELAHQSESKIDQKYRQFKLQFDG